VPKYLHKLSMAEMVVGYRGSFTIEVRRVLFNIRIRRY